MSEHSASLARMYFEMFMQMKKQLLQLDKWLESATAYADSKKFDAKNFLSLRLVVDQFPFVRQVQAVCDVAKLGASRITGKPAPSHADDEATMEQLRERIRSTVSYLETFGAADFEKAATASRWPTSLLPLTGKPTPSKPTPPGAKLNNLLAWGV